MAIVTRFATENYTNEKIASIDILSNQNLSEEQKALARENLGIDPAVVGLPGQFVMIGEDGKLIAQTVPFSTFYKSSSEPDDSIGNDGDLYLVKG